jgi:hypothetical protein
MRVPGSLCAILLALGMVAPVTGYLAVHRESYNDCAIQTRDLWAKMGRTMERMSYCRMRTRGDIATHDRTAMEFYIHRCVNYPSLLSSNIPIRISLPWLKDSGFDREACNPDLRLPAIGEQFAFDPALRHGKSIIPTAEYLRPGAPYTPGWTPHLRPEDFSGASFFPNTRDTVSPYVAINASAGVEFY